MDKIAMNEYNKPRFVNPFSDLVDYLDEKQIPYVMTNQTINFICAFPNTLHKIIDLELFNKKVSGDYAHYWQNLSKFIADKPCYNQFKEIHEYLNLKTNK